MTRFVDEETKLLNNPLYSWQATQQYAEKKDKDKKTVYSCQVTNAF